MRLLFLLILLCAARPLRAHEGSVSFLTLGQGEHGVLGQWHVAIKDLDLLFGLDGNGDQNISWGELKARFSEIDPVLSGALQFEMPGGTAQPEFTEHLIDQRSGAGYLVYRFSLPRMPQKINYSFYFDSDASHRAIIQVGEQSLVITAGRRSVDLLEKASASAFLTDGLWHIWSGLDHILFLIALILPSAMKRAGGWQFWPVLKVVTAFTVAHSLTLALAVSGWVNLPARWVELVIAFSVLLAALNNLKPVWNEGAWVVAFAFGLIHGFGFAGPLMDAHLGGGELARALLLFNLGVEAGQAAIVACALPFLWWVSNGASAGRHILRLGSAAIAVIAAIWFVERI